MGVDKKSQAGGQNVASLRTKSRKFRTKSRKLTGQQVDEKSQAVDRMSQAFARCRILFLKGYNSMSTPSDSFL